MRRSTLAVEREWDVDSVVGYVFSLSFCSPATFGEEKEAFDSDLRAYLNRLEDERFVQHTEVEVISGKKPGKPSGR
ncbi:hypothetical protein SAMN04487948_10246 [Halogranum amylolyticum]|uniref:Uncharacterized protein n=1 Tax=Halogranum amylolyticum TaxID=660520 RepID=A0A1H8P1Q3_9EURY|nr:hypothetical protein [Halogranum amylolyticum]SEO35802.1 hypothetical protein SAMN04487948_10246 [Halogranum amylolyticum]